MPKSKPVRLIDLAVSVRKGDLKIDQVASNLRGAVKRIADNPNFEFDAYSHKSKRAHYVGEPSHRVNNKW